MKDKDIYADYPDSAQNLTELFHTRLSSLLAEFQLVDSKKEAATTLLELLKQSDPMDCKTHNFTLINELISLDDRLKSYLNKIDDAEITSIEFADCKIGITAADYLIARTGSIMLSAQSAGGRRLSVLPPTHIVIAEENQLVFSLDDVFEHIDHQNKSWSYATFITGPSRTSDIEKQLVLGAHGPKRLIVLLIKS